MHHIKDDVRHKVDTVSQRFGFSTDAGITMLESLVAGRGRMAQFRHAEFGGSGQWMAGGMTMVSDLFDSSLKARVAGLCDELTRILADEPGLLDVRSDENAGSAGAAWWPADFGRPDATGSQNGVRYASFGAARRLVLDDGHRTTIYDTLDHRIAGVAQQQPGSGAPTFTSQRGTVDVATLPIVSTGRADAAPSADTHEPTSGRAHETTSGRAHESTLGRAHETIGTLEKLGELHDKGILNDQEFAAKKAELLGRI